MKAKYVAYDESNTIVKEGEVEYGCGEDEDAEIRNFCEAVYQDVGATLYEDKVAGVRGF